MPLWLQVVSWWGPTWRAGSHDTQGVNTDQVLGLVLAEAEQQEELKVAFHLEPYEGERQQQQQQQHGQRQQQLARLGVSVQHCRLDDLLSRGVGGCQGGRQLVFSQQLTQHAVTISSSSSSSSSTKPPRHMHICG